MILSPSTADSTEIAGVIMLSPKNSAAPKRPSDGQRHRRAPPAAAGPTAQQRDQRHDAALAVVVGAHHQRDVGQRDDDHHRPEDQRHDAVHVGVGERHRVRVARVEDRLDRVDRAGPDVTENDAKCSDHYGQAQRLAYRLRMSSARRRSSPRRSNRLSAFGAQRRQFGVRRSTRSVSSRLFSLSPRRCCRGALPSACWARICTACPMSAWPPRSSRGTCLADRRALLGWRRVASLLDGAGRTRRRADRAGRGDHRRARRSSPPA